MQTLVTMVNRVKSMESHAGASVANLNENVRFAINEGLRSLYYNNNPWYWNDLTTEIAATDSGTVLVLPEDTIHLLGVYASNDKPVNPRTRQRQLDEKISIGNANTNTYALDGIDTDTGFAKIALYPASDETYTVRYQIAPTELSADGDTPDGPNPIADYLVWYARTIRLESDEERQRLVSRSEARYKDHLASLKRMNVHFVRSLKQFLSLPGASK